VPGQDQPHYANPPVEEGLCQVQFSAPLAWSVATPGQLFEAVRHAYPADPEAQDQLAASFQVQNASPTLALNRGAQRYIYKDETATRLLIASPTTLSVNSLRPYEGWSALRQRLHEAMSSLASVLPLPSISQVSLRYVNRIVVPTKAGVDTDDYFNLTVRTAEQGRASFVGFMHRVESILTDESTRVISTFATIEAPEDQVHFLLDLEFRSSNLPETATVDDVLSVADDLKLKENAEFESCLTDKARGLFS
jgi:uncharacterized protein (TIGR04255 family)